MKIRTPRRRSALAIAVCLAMTGGGLATATYATAGATPSNTLDLRILLIGDGPTDVTTAAWGSALANEGVPYTEVDATGTSPSETIALPALSSGTTGYFNGVVIADSPTAFAAGQLAALDTYESTFGVRQVDGYMYPDPALGATDATGGALDNTVGTLTVAGLTAFPELAGPVPFAAGTWGYGATTDVGAPFTPILDSTAGNALVGVYQHPSGDAQAGVAEMSLFFDYNSNMLQWLLLAPGLINWVTQGAHLGLYRSYFGQDIDDVFIADNEWSSTYQCTPGAQDPPDYTCPAGVANNPADTPPDVQMSAADVAYVVAWEQKTGITLNMLFNAVGACTAPATNEESTANCTGSVVDRGGTFTDPGQVIDNTTPNDAAFVDALLGQQANFDWETHTWSHQFLGCNLWAPQPFTSAVANVGGGALAAGTYSYEITAATAYGESEPSAPLSATVGADGSVTLNWPEAINGVGQDGTTAGPTLAQLEATFSGGDGFWGYNIYRAGPASTTYGLIAQVPENTSATFATTYSYTDNGSTTPSGSPGSSGTFPTATDPGIDCSNTAGSWDPATSANPDSSIEQEIGLDQAFAAANGLTNYNPGIIVTGEHSGLESPNMATAFQGTGITVFGSDGSRQPQSYTIAGALSSPRYPSNIYYNASNWPDELSEYNTLYVAAGDSIGNGQTGRCEGTGTTTCRTTPGTEADVLASESSIMLSHVLANNPRVNYAHQTNLIGPATAPGGADYGYTILGLIGNMQDQYDSYYNAANSPLVHINDAIEAQTLADQAAWATTEAGTGITASDTDGTVTVSNSGSAVEVPITVPAGTTVNGAPFGTPYGGQLSAWVELGTGATEVLGENVAPQITSAAAAASNVGAAFSFIVATTGAPTAALTETGALPGGVTFTDNGNGTATIAGTPTTSSGGTYPLVITATNAAGTTTQDFTLTNDEAPTITSVAAATFTTTLPGTYTVTTTGFPAPAITEVGALPEGMTFTDNGNGTATLTGVPAATAAGQYAISVTATNAADDSLSTLSLAVTVDPATAPTISTATGNATADFTLGQMGSFAISTAGFPTPAITATAVTLPAGLSFTVNAGGTALLYGTPTATGTVTFDVTAANGISPDATLPVTVVVGSAPAITSASTATATTGNPFSFTVTTAGYPAPSIGGSGLPAGITLTDNGNGTATIAGTAATSEVGTYTVDLSAVNGTGPTSQVLTLTVVSGAPAITSSADPTFAAKTASTFTVTASGAPAPALSETGALPSGVTFTDNGNGTATLAGTPAEGTQGTYALVITATNTSGTATEDLSLLVNSGLAITSTSSATATGGKAFSFTVTATGTPTPTLSHTGTLPSGVTFTAGTNGTATLAGTPSASASGVYAITFTAKNSTGTASQAFTLTVDQLPTYSNAATVTETAGTAFAFTVSTKGYPVPALSAGTLPSGVSFVDNGNGTGTLAGTTSVAAGTYSVTITAANAGGSANQVIALTVKTDSTKVPVPAFTSAATATAKAGAAFTFTVTTTGSPTTTYTTSVTHTGTLPSGLSFTNLGNGTATISGTPTAASGGTYALTLTAKNSAGTTTQSFVLTVQAGPTITSAATATATDGSAFNFTVKTSGSPAPAMSETGALPSGVTFTDNGNGTATLAGTPGLSQGGVYKVTFTATNTYGSVTQSFTLTVDQAPAITSASSASATHGKPYSFTFTGTGYPLPTVTHTGTAKGLTYTRGTNGTATLSGTPTTAGTYKLTITATNSVGTATQTFTLTVS